MSSSNPTSFGKKGETGPTHVLVVRGLDENADEEMLRYEFSKNAPIKDIRLVRDKFTHVSRGFAFVHFHSVDIAIPEVFVGGLLGSMLIFLFSAWACAAVGRTAQEVVNEVRRQFIERPGIMDYKEKPDYGRCVAIVASASLRDMIKPGALAVLSPTFIGILFRVLGYYTGQPLLGAKVVAAMLMFATVSGILMALFLNTAGGAWDNAKKYIETGALGGKRNDSHKAAITGDTVGDPFKDTAGPSLHVLIKMLATITLVMAPIFL